MENSILVSVKPKYKKLLFSKEKIYEYRNVSPKKKVKYMFVYETLPLKQISYLLVVDEPLIFPSKITKNTFGKERFNNGSMNCKLAYPIKNIYAFDPISLERLKSDYGFVVPQSFIYLDSNPDLKEKLINLEMIKIW